MSPFTVKALSPDTFEPYADLLERNNGGGMGGCWCMWMHYETTAQRREGGASREIKQQRVLAGNAHAAVVFDGATAVGWCQFGPPAELPGQTHLKDIYYEGAPHVDYRIGCFMVDRKRRKEGVANAALAGALDLIAKAGGGVVEAYPYDVGGAKVSSSFLYNGTREMFERAGFTYDRVKGKNHCIMRKTVMPA